MTVSTRHILRSATYLLFVLFGTAGIYFCSVTLFWVPFKSWYAPEASWYCTCSPSCSPVEKATAPNAWNAVSFWPDLVATLSGAAIVLFITLTHKFTPTTDSGLKPVSKPLATHYWAVTSTVTCAFRGSEYFTVSPIIGGLLIARKR